MNICHIDERKPAHCLRQPAQAGIHHYYMVGYPPKLVTYLAYKPEKIVSFINNVIRKRTTLFINDS